jgi:hypothetical protein
MGKSHQSGGDSAAVIRTSFCDAVTSSSVRGIQAE